MSPNVPLWSALTETDDRAGAQASVLTLLSVSKTRGVVRYSSLFPERVARANTLTNYKIAKCDDIVLNKMSAASGAVGVANENGLVSPDYAVFRVRSENEPRYLNHLLRSDWILSQVEVSLRGIGTGDSQNVRTPRIAIRDYLSLRAPLPDLPTQRRIADYLDRETTQIDKMTEALDGLVARLEERRSETVRDAFISAAKMSKLAKIQYAATVLVGIVITPAKYYVERGNGIPAVRALNLTPTGIDADNLIEISPEGHQVNSRSTLYTGDIATVRTGKVGLSAVVQDELSGANAIDIVISRPHNSIRPDYLCSFLNSPIAREYMNLEKVGSVQSHLNVDAMKKLPIPLPPLDEQRRIADHLDTETAKIDAMIAKAGELRALLDERRSALITATVTGQHPVPEEP